MYKQKAAYNDGMASRYQAPPRPGCASSRRPGRRRSSRASSRSRCGCAVAAPASGRWSARRLELTGLMKPFDLEVWYGERVAVLGSNGSGKSHFLRLLAAGGSDPDVEHRPVERRARSSRSPHTGTGQARRAGAAGLVRADPRPPRAVGRTLLEILHRGDEPPRRDGPREPAARALDRYELAHAAEQRFESLSGGQQARLPDPAARAVRRDPAAARRADRQPRHRVRRGAGGRAWRRSRAPSSP